MTLRNIKSAIAVAASIAALSGTIMPIMAEDTQSNKSTTINYEVAETYDWTVPASVTFTDNGTTAKTGTVSVTKNVIGYGKILVISIDSNEDFALKDSTESKNTRTYKVFVGSGSTALAKAGEVLKTPAGTNTSNVSLTFKLDSISVEKSGSYSDTLAFNSVVK